MKVKIYQADINAKNKFMGLEFTNSHCGGVNKEDYRLVFEGHVVASNLEDVFCAFNRGRAPDGYKGHSMSVSDIIVNDVGAFYCDCFGFKRIEF